MVLFAVRQPYFRVFLGAIHPRFPAFVQVAGGLLCGVLIMLTYSLFSSATETLSYGLLG